MKCGSEDSYRPLTQEESALALFHAEWRELALDHRLRF